MSSREAQLKANEYNLDLFCVAPNATPPVCKILNYGKYRYEQQKKAKENRKNQVRIEVKEIQAMNRRGEKPETLKQDVVAAPEFIDAVGDDAINRFDPEKRKKRRNRNRNRNKK